MPNPRQGRFVARSRRPPLQTASKTAPVASLYGKTGSTADGNRAGSLMQGGSDLQMAGSPSRRVQLLQSHEETTPVAQPTSAGERRCARGLLTGRPACADVHSPRYRSWAPFVAARQKKRISRLGILLLDGDATARAPCDSACTSAAPHSSASAADRLGPAGASARRPHRPPRPESHSSSRTRKVDFVVQRPWKPHRACSPLSSLATAELSNPQSLVGLDARDYGVAVRCTTRRRPARARVNATRRASRA